MAELWYWLVQSDSGQYARIAVGVGIFACLAAVDLKRHGHAARRWKEYLFLVICVVLALAYGIVNDQVTVGISWEYFYYGKDLAAVVGGNEPPTAVTPALRWAAAGVGMKATWSAGLILGVILLFANNPSQRMPVLPWRRVYRLLPLLVLTPAVCGAILGLVGWWGGLVGLNSDFPQLIQDNLWRPNRFMAVYGIHLGGYIGGLLGAMMAVVIIRRARHHSTLHARPPALA